MRHALRRMRSMFDDEDHEEYHKAHENKGETPSTELQYTWLVRTLLDGLKEHAGFQEKYPNVAAPNEMKTIWNEMEAALLKSMHLLYCSEQIGLLKRMRKTAEPADVPQLDEWIGKLQSEIEASDLSATMQAAEAIHTMDEWKTFIPASGWTAPTEKPETEQFHWMKQSIPKHPPAFMENILEVFPQHKKLEKATRRVQRQIKRSSLGWRVLRESLELGSSAFQVESSVDRNIKSDMRRAPLSTPSTTEA